MALHTEPLGGEGVIGVGLSRGILHAGVGHGLTGEGIGINQVERAAVEAHILPHCKVTWGEQAAVSLLNPVAPDQDSLLQQWAWSVS